MKTKDKIQKFWKKIPDLRKAGCNLVIVLLRYLYYYVRFRKEIIAHQKTTINGIKKIEMASGSRLEIGTRYRGILKKSDETLINVRGTLKINGRVSISRGVIIDVDEKGILELEDGVVINSFTMIVCADKTIIGEGTEIGWGCHFLDSDFHESSFMGGKFLSSPIIIGKNVRIGHHVHIEKGVFIADRCKIRQNSIIDRCFTEPGCMISTKREYGMVKYPERS